MDMGISKEYRDSLKAFASRPGATYADVLSLCDRLGELNRRKGNPLPASALEKIEEVVIGLDSMVGMNELGPSDKITPKDDALVKSWIQEIEAVL